MSRKLADRSTRALEDRTTVKQTEYENRETQTDGKQMRVMHKKRQKDEHIYNIRTTHHLPMCNSKKRKCM